MTCRTITIHTCLFQRIHERIIVHVLTRVRCGLTNSAPAGLTDPQLSAAIVAAPVLVVASCTQGSFLVWLPTLLRHAINGSTRVTERPGVPAAIDTGSAKHLNRTRSEDFHLRRLSLRRHRQGATAAGTAGCWFCSLEICRGSYAICVGGGAEGGEVPFPFFSDSFSLF
jgi:hypothetical protein